MVANLRVCGLAAAAAAGAFFVADRPASAADEITIGAIEVDAGAGEQLANARRSQFRGDADQCVMCLDVLVLVFAGQRHPRGDH